MSEVLSVVGCEPWDANILSVELKAYCKARSSNILSQEVGPGAKCSIVLSDMDGNA